MHPTDQELLMSADGELSHRRQTQVRQHLQSCWTCRKRMSELETTIAAVIDSYQVLDTVGNGAEAVLRARLLSESPGAPSRSAHWLTIAACALLLCAVAAIWYKSQPNFIVPNPSLTPGEAVNISRTEVCQGNPRPRNQQVSDSLREAVFTEYGMKNAPRNAYEVDFLITPELGGASSLRNLWPQPYSKTTWNAQAKDALEERMHDMVCSGELDLETAQREMATNWVDAYKKYVGSR